MKLLYQIEVHHQNMQIWLHDSWMISCMCIDYRSSKLQFVDDHVRRFLKLMKLGQHQKMLICSLFMSESLITGIYDSWMIGCMYIQTIDLVNCSLYYALLSPFIASEAVDVKNLNRLVYLDRSSTFMCTYFLLKFDHCCKIFFWFF